MKTKPLGAFLALCTAVLVLAGALVGCGKASTGIETVQAAIVLLNIDLETDPASEPEPEQQPEQSDEEDAVPPEDADDTDDTAATDEDAENEQEESTEDEEDTDSTADELDQEGALHQSVFADLLDTIYDENWLRGQLLLGDTVTLEADVTLGDTVVLGQNATIQGGYTIRLADGFSGRHFVVDANLADSVSFNGLTLDGGDKGGGIEVNGGGPIALSISGATLQNNRSAGVGGAVCIDTNAGAQLNVTDSRFTANTAAQGGGIYNNKGDSSISESTFSGNAATGGDGGGIYGRVLNVSGGSFATNTASEYGGALYAEFDGDWNANPVVVNGGSYTGNTATLGGGGMGFRGENRVGVEENLGNYSVAGVTMSGNSARDGGAIWTDDISGLRVESATLSGNNAANQGGAIYSEGAPKVKGSTLTGNTAMNGGAISVTFNLTVDGGSISGNTATNLGGGVYTDQAAIMDFQHVVMTNNTAQGETGGAIYSYDYKAIYTNGVTFSGNKATKGVFWTYLDPDDPANTELLNSVSYEYQMENIAHFANILQSVSYSGGFNNAYNGWDISYWDDIIPEAGPAYVVSFLPAGGTWPDGTATPRTITLPAGSKVPEPGELPSIGDDAAAGWYKDADMTEPWDFERDTVAEDTFLYAAYLYDVIYVVEGEVYHKDEGMFFGLPILQPELPALDEHEFVGWYRGSMEDVPLAPLGRDLQPAAQPAAARVYWLFDTDTMPGETLVLIGDFNALAVVPTPGGEERGDGGEGEGGGSGATGETGGTGGDTTPAGTTRTTATLRTTGYRGSVPRTGDAGGYVWYVAAAAATLLGLGMTARRKGHAKAK